MIEGAGGLGPRQWRGQILRRRNERWMRDLVAATRRGQSDLAPGSPLRTVAFHRDVNDELLDLEVAAVEMINILRATVAVARYGTFAALALHEYPEARERIVSGGEHELDDFAQEVRRVYPFFPFVGGRARSDLEWRGETLSAGQWLLLDIYGTNHDPRSWEDPERFDPERFHNWIGDPFALIPQGAGAHESGHRCPGEWITVALIRLVASFLGSAIEYAVPPQDLTVDLARMPALPASGLVITNIRLR